MNAFVEILPDVVGTEIFGNRHLVVNREEQIVVVVDAVVEDGFHDEVLFHLYVEKVSVEPLKHLLHGQCHVSRSTGKIDPVVSVLIETSQYRAANLLIRNLIHVVLQYNLVYLRCRNIE